MKFIDYAKHLNANQEVLNWIEKRMDENVDITEGEHVIDFLVSDKCPKLERATYAQMKKKADAWVKAMNKKGEHIKETEADTETVLDFGDGFRVVKLVGKNAYEREGHLMRHCVASYYGRDVEVYSLRDSKNMPHCTIEKDKQIKGKGNGDIHPKYIDYVVRFLEHTGMDVRDSEMGHLGYIPVDDVIEDLHEDHKSQLYRNKYIRHDVDLLNADGKPYFSLEILDRKPIVVDTEDSVKLSVNLPLFISEVNKTAVKKYKATVEMDYNRIAAKDYNRIAAEDYNHIAVRDYNLIAVRDGNRIAVRDSNRIAVRDSNHIAGDDNNRIAVRDNNRIAGDDSNHIAAEDYNHIAVRDYNLIAVRDGNRIAGEDGNHIAAREDNRIAGDDNNRIAVRDSNRIAVRDNNRIAGDDNNRIAARNSNRIAADRFNSIAVGTKSLVVAGFSSKVKGKKGSGFALGVYDDDTNLINILSAFIDGETYKEDTWYWVKDGQIVEYQEEK